MTLWGGRFDGEPDEVTWEYTVDRTDAQLLSEDIEGSIAHAEMLGATGVIPSEDAQKLVNGLNQILMETIQGGFEYLATDEDIHTAVERRLEELVGPVAGKLHTGRSRNDQVATDLRLHLKGSTLGILDQTGRLLQVLVEIARDQASTVVPSYTHLQQAQSTTLGEHLLAHAWALSRDVQRFWDFGERFDESPLGAGASAGTALPIDRDMTAEALGFAGTVPNPLDAVGSRDIASEFVFACAQSMVHLSRLAEEVILWSTREFGWVTLSDDVSTGSSALPHKRNPDIAELVRGRTASVIGDVTAILTLQKALPLTYNRDFQEDKRIVIHSGDVLYQSLAAMTTLLSGLSFHPPVPSAEVATIDLADALVTRGVPFREAHRIVGQVVKSLESKGKSIEDLTGEDLVAVDDRFKSADAEIVDPMRSVEKRYVAETVAAEIQVLEMMIQELISDE